MCVLKSIKIFFLAILFILPISISKSQTFGFGCLGLSGFYAGFSQQQYNVGGINDYIKINYYGPLPTSNVEFKKGSGYRIGANIFRAKFDALFISAKGYYQFMKENLEQNQTEQNSFIRNKYQISMNHWGLAVDVGVPLFWIFDWKVVEGGITFHKTEFTHEVLRDEIQLSESKFEPEKNRVNYYIGSGLIIHIVPDYLSIEGTASYSFMKVDELNNQSPLLVGPDKISNSINKGGFMATIQLNIGFPL
ncbi:MAG: hypothetical protein RDU14_02940 [Melioribacteraceae bacterium]|nr:hypothetical protein [Melioribacteraceae bacterium]